MEVAEQVNEMFTDIFNNTLESGHVPEDCVIESSK